MKKISALLLTFILTLFFTLSFFPATAFAADATIDTGGIYDISSFDDGAAVTINGGLSVTLTNTTAIIGKNLKISCVGANTHLTIDGVNINSSGCALAFTGAGNTLTLIGSSTLTSGNIESGIRVEGSTELTISGTGSVEATGDDGGAGIGGGHMNDGGNITISGGTVTAHGGVKAAGIGGGYYSDAEEITITGGIVTAHGGENAAGIGGGDDGDSGNITISGGTVTAHGGCNAAGIGGGDDGDSGNINISDGTVTAHGGCNAAGIGGGYYGDAEEITITGGTVNAYSYSEGISGAGIGGGTSGSGGKIIIEGGTVSAYATNSSDGTPGAGIGCGAYGSGAEILITGGTINATSTSPGAAIGGSIYCSDVSVTITGGTIIANGDASGIGSGFYSSNCSVTINGNAKVTATGRLFGIGVGENSPGCTVTIGGSAQVTATGGDNGAGIGSFGDGVDVTINGGEVFASGGTMDIGHGNSGTDEGTLTISGDSAVFFENDTFPTPTTSHTYFSTLPSDANGEIYGVKLPSGWTEASGYYSDTIALLVEYDSNGALGTEPDDAIKLMAESLTFTAEYADYLSYTGATFVKWNTEADGSGTDIFPAFTYTAYTDITLYAIWNKTMISLTLDKSSLSLTQDESYKLTASYTPSDANSTIFWISSDNSVATVDQSGNVKAIGEGSVTITASTGAREATCTVTVSKKSVSSISLNYGKQSMYVGDVFALSAVVLPEDATNKSIKWTTSDSSVAKVTSAGLVSAIGKGTCTITAAADGVSDSCTVSVSLAPTPTPSPTATPQPYVDVESVRLMLETNFTAVLYVGDTMVLSANVIPSNADNQSLVWKSSDESVLTVSSYGLVKAVSAGEATVTVTAGIVSDSYAITVKAAGDMPSPSTSPTSADATPSPLPSVGDVMLNFAINTENLPYGAEYILLPDGEMMPLSDESTMTVCVNQCHLNDGVLQITALDAEQNPLGAVDVSAEKAAEYPPYGLCLSLSPQCLQESAGHWLP